MIIVCLSVLVLQVPFVGKGIADLHEKITKQE